jgi:hypothetical protein
MQVMKERALSKVGRTAGNLRSAATVPPVTSVIRVLSFEPLFLFPPILGTVGHLYISLPKALPVKIQKFKSWFT